MLKTFVMPHMAPITETFDLQRATTATQNLVKLGGFDLLARFSAVVDMGSSNTLPQSTENYYFVFGDVINGQALIIADALNFLTKELRVSTHKKTSTKTSKTAEEIAILEDILKELKDQNQEATIQNIINSLEKRKKTSTKTPNIGTVLSNAGKQDIVSVGRCVIRKLEAEIRSKKDRKTGQVVLYRSCDQLT
ncbi:MAG: hypothetical protein RXN95_00360 [Hydrogenobaculum sp.]|jgi:hypothetical protein